MKNVNGTYTEPELPLLTPLLLAWGLHVTNDRQCRVISARGILNNLRGSATPLKQGLTRMLSKVTLDA